MFAQGLAGMVEGFVGNPEAEGRNALAASQALLNNQTAQYRDAIGETGLSGDLSSMMIRALQAGPDYSRYADSAASDSLKYGSIGFGSPDLTPEGSIASLIAAHTGSPGGRARSPGSTTGSNGATVQTSDLTQGELNRVGRMVRDAGFDGAQSATVQGAVIEAYATGQYGTLDEAAAAVLPGAKVENVTVGTNPNVAWDGDKGFMGEFMDMFRGPSDITEPQVTFKDAAPSASPDEANVLDQARAAIAAGKDPRAVAARLKEMGIDPGRL